MFKFPLPYNMAARTAGTDRNEEITSPYVFPGQGCVCQISVITITQPQNQFV